MPRIFKPLEWGQTKQIQPADWHRDKPITIVTKDADEPESHVVLHNVKNPVTKNLTLGCNIPSPTRANLRLGGSSRLVWAEAPKISKSTRARCNS